MTFITPLPNRWLKHTPRGQLIINAPMKNRTWFKVGGWARIFFIPADHADLRAVFAEYPVYAPLSCLGIGSNTLIRDGGVDALVVYLGKSFVEIIRLDSHRFMVGAGVRSMRLAKQAADWGLSGISFLAGIPGSIGGALAMNAGAYGGETFDYLEAVHWLDRKNKLHYISKVDIDYGYRYCALKNGIFISAFFCCPQENPKNIHQEIIQIQQLRKQTQPIGVMTSGSTFKNPTKPSPITGEMKWAWQWIDAAGCRGLRHGGAMIDTIHCNFIVNTGGALARDIEELGEIVYQRVKKYFAIELEWEIHRLGKHNI